MIPLFENIVFPLIEKYKGSKITLTSKLISGLIIAALGALVAAGLVCSSSDKPADSAALPLTRLSVFQS
jgi:hypothetical protein